MIECCLCVDWTPGKLGSALDPWMDSSIGRVRSGWSCDGFKTGSVQQWPQLLENEGGLLVEDCTQFFRSVSGADDYGTC